jgi:transposase-like protein
MARTGRSKADLALTDQEREQLLRWARRAKSAQSLSLRSKIILRCAEGMDNASVAAQLGCSTATVGKWRRRFVEDRLDGLTDEPRPGAPRSVSDDQVDRHDAITDTQSRHTRSQLVNHDAAFRPVVCARKCDSTVRGKHPAGKQDPAERSHDHDGDKQRNPCPAGQI